MSIIGEVVFLKVLILNFMIYCNSHLIVIEFPTVVYYKIRNYIVLKFIYLKLNKQIIKFKKVLDSPLNCNDNITLQGTIAH